MNEVCSRLFVKTSTLAIEKNTAIQYNLTNTIFREEKYGFQNSANIVTSRDDIEKLTKGMEKFSVTVQGTFEQLQTLKEVATSDN